MTSTTIKVAAVQAAPVSFDLEKSIEKVAKLTKEAAAEAGADLVVFPEGFLSAYPWRYAFDATIGAREPRGIVFCMNISVIGANTGRPKMVCEILQICHSHRLSRIRKASCYS
jgi:hypothetical protein